MKICGIVAEYNPFHNGHAYHCAKTRDQIGDETAIVAVMSGNFVQRGDFAIVDKYRLAAMAVCAGVDLVIELPLPAALSSAEACTRCGRVLAAMGCVTHLSFGSECGDITRIRRPLPATARPFAIIWPPGILRRSLTVCGRSCRSRCRCAALLAQQHAGNRILCCHRCTGL
ncbi:MAG: nucleotidyltransferase family protein [Butyricicoccus pullicaecorum]